MKKIAMFLAVCMMGAMLSFAQSEDEVKAESQTPISAEMKALQTAYSLAEYGYSVESASALIEAAEIVASVPTQPLTDVKIEGETATGTSGKTYTAEQLLEDGKKLAAGDKTLLKLANEVEKSIKKGTRGAVGGPRYAYNAVSAGHSIYYYISFRAREYAEVLVQSFSNVDLDLYIYDENGHLIASDSSYRSDAYVCFVPRWTGVFKVVVKNRSSRFVGDYKLTTN